MHRISLETGNSVDRRLVKFVHKDDDGEGRGHEYKGERRKQQFERTERTDNRSPNNSS